MIIITDSESSDCTCQLNGCALTEGVGGAEEAKICVTKRVDLFMWSSLYVSLDWNVLVSR